MSLTGKLRAALAAALIFALLCCALAEEVAAGAPENTAGPKVLDEEALFGESLLLMDGDTGEVLYTRNSRVRMYPASTTKIMTLLLALESGKGMDEVVTVPKEAGNIAEGSSVIPVRPGDKLTFGDLLYGFMLNSGNDGANAIAVLVDGSISRFVERMNARAEQMGCEGTHFANAHGFHKEDHYTTAQDLAKITLEAMKNETFRQIVAAPDCTVRILRNGKKVVEEIPSRVLMVREGEKYYYPGCTGVKTGHTNKAGYCFVGTASRDGVNLLSVTLNCPKEDQKWYDAARLFEYGFSLYEAVPLGDLMRQAASEQTAVTIENAAESDPAGGQVQLIYTQQDDGGLTRNLIRGSEVSMRHAVEEIRGDLNIEWIRELTAPLKAGEVLANVTYTTPEGQALTAQLTSPRDVAVKVVETPTPKPTKASGGTAVSLPGLPAREGNGAPVWLFAGLGGLIALGAALTVAIQVREKRRREKLRRQRLARKRRREAAARAARSPE